jgi:hypothetical protein
MEKGRPTMIDVDCDWDAYEGSTKSADYLDRLLDRGDDSRDQAAGR